MNSAAQTVFARVVAEMQLDANQIETILFRSSKHYPETVRLRARVWMKMRERQPSGIQLSLPEVAEVFGTVHSTIHSGIARERERQEQERLLGTEQGYAQSDRP